MGKRKKKRLACGPISARIVSSTVDHLGVAYGYPGGGYEAHPIGPADFHIIHQLKWIGSLSYDDEHVHDLAIRQGP
jgi:hypothetical protein